MKSFKQGNGRGESYLERWINNNGGGDDLMLFDVSGHRIEWPLINRQVMEFIGCCIQGGWRGSEGRVWGVHGVAGCRRPYPLTLIPLLLCSDSCILQFSLPLLFPLLFTPFPSILYFPTIFPSFLHSSLLHPPFL